MSKENKKEGPTLRVKVKVCPLLASAWQKAMHWEAKSESSSLIAAIFRLHLNHEFSLVSQKKTHVDSSRNIFSFETFSKSGIFFEFETFF